MTDKEKVIKGLEHCISRYVDGLCDDCPYMGELDKSYMIPMKCKEIIMRDALAILNEQKTVIRCNDCTYLNADTGICIVGIPHGYKDIFYCAYGKRLVKCDANGEK